MAKIVKKNSMKAVALVVAIAMTAFYASLIDTTYATQVTTRSDTLNNSNISATSNHSIVFTLQDALDATYPTSSDTITIAFDPGSYNFNLANIDCGDIDLTFGAVATSISSGWNGGNRDTRTNCPGNATSWGVMIDTSNDTITISTPSSTAVYVAAGVAVTINIGSNATNQDTGDEEIYNPGSAGYYIVRVGGTFGGSGDLDVYAISTVQLSVTVGETLTFGIQGLPGITFSNGADIMTGCTNDANDTSYTDNDDNVSITPVTTTAATVPYGQATAGSFYQGCQRLSISTNAQNGFSISHRENNPLMRTTGSAAAISDTTCDTNSCPSNLSSGLWTSGNGLGVSCTNSGTSVTCSTSAPNYGTGASQGDNWVPFGAESLGNTTSTRFSTVASATSGTILVKAKYRLKVPSNQESGTYTNTVSWIATPTY